MHTLNPNSTSNEKYVEKKWYLQFWPWFLISFPAIAVIAGIITIIIAVKTDDGLVNDDYYKAGLAINKTLTLEKNAQALNLSSDINWDELTQTFSLTLDGKLSPLPQQLTLTLAHATQANNDQIITLFLAPNQKSYSGRSQRIKQGNWYIILEPKDFAWRLKGRVTLPSQTQWHITSN